MNLIYAEISKNLSEAAAKGYRGGLAAMVKLNKKNILKLQEAVSIEHSFAEPLFKISYTNNDERLLNNFNVEAFTVAGVLSYEAEEKLKAMARSIIDGTHPYMQRHPESSAQDLWRDEAYNILADYIEVADMPPPSTLNTNLRTAVTSSYNAAQYQRLQELKDIYPAYKYMTREDSRVREEHAALHGKVFSAADPIWDIIYPPNGYNCRCYVEPLSYDELGGVKPQDRVDIADETQRKEYIKELNVEKDFARNSGKSESIWGKWLQSKFKDLDYNKKFKDVFDYSRSVGRYQEKGLVESVLDKNKTGFVSKELTRESWEKEFPDNEAVTPIGTAKLTGGKQWDTQFEKMLSKEDGRYKFFGLIKPTLKDPAFIIKDDKGGLIFVRKFEGKTETVFFSIGYKDGELLSIISNHKKDLLSAIKKLENGEVLQLSASALSEFTDSTRAHITPRGNALKFGANLQKYNDACNEVWGEFVKQGKTIIYKIKYRVEGFILARDLSNEKEVKESLHPYSEIDNYRKGVLMQ